MHLAFSNLQLINARGTRHTAAVILIGEYIGREGGGPARAAARAHKTLPRESERADLQRHTCSHTHTRACMCVLLYTTNN